MPRAAVLKEPRGHEREYRGHGTAAANFLCQVPQTKKHDFWSYKSPVMILFIVSAELDQVLDILSRRDVRVKSGKVSIFHEKDPYKSYEKGGRAPGISISNENADIEA